MLFSARTKGLLGLILVGWGVSSYAEDLKLWQIGEKPPIFYQEPTSTSQKLLPLKPSQTMIILHQQKDWVKLANLTNGETGWVQQDQVKQTAIINLIINKTPYAYHYQMRMRSDGNQQTGSWNIAGSIFSRHAKPKNKSLKEKLGFKKKHVSQHAFDEQMAKEFEVMEKRFSDMCKHGFGFPVLQPVVVVPNDANPLTNNAKKASSDVPPQETNTAK